MIVAFSTSSPLASVALIDVKGAIIASGEELAPMGASGACLKVLRQLLQDNGLTLKGATLFLSDLGPGSFTGVKVGVTLAKSLAFANGTPAGGISSFDLISATETVVLPSKRGEWFVRHPGEEAMRTNDLPSSFVGYGAGIEDPVYPHASRFSLLLLNIKPIEPEMLVPEYLIEPSISTPKKPF